MQMKGFDTKMAGPRIFSLGHGAFIFRRQFSQLDRIFFNVGEKSWITKYLSVRAFSFL